MHTTSHHINFAPPNRDLSASNDAISLRMRLRCSDSSQCIAAIVGASRPLPLPIPSPSLMFIYRAHANFKGVALCESTCFCLLSAPSKRLPLLRTLLRTSVSIETLTKRLLRTLLRSVQLHDPGVRPNLFHRIWRGLEVQLYANDLKCTLPVKFVRDQLILGSENECPMKLRSTMIMIPRGNAY